MPTIPPNDINDLPKPERKKAVALFFERSVLQYAFSYKKLALLLKMLNDAGGHDFTDDQLNTMLCDCVCAWTEDECRVVKSELNDAITTLFTENGIEKTLRNSDPFGREKDYVMMEGVATSFSQARALPLAVSGVFEWRCPTCKQLNFTTSQTNVSCTNAKCDSEGSPFAKVKVITRHAMAAEAVTAVFKAATQQTRYVTLQARDVKEAPENGNGKRGK